MHGVRQTRKIEARLLYFMLMGTGDTGIHRPVHGVIPDALIKGGGGDQPDPATAGGKEPGGMAEALRKAAELLG
jgi:hypothetical protein